MKRHEVHVFANGKASIRDLQAGETMHSEVGPDEEAHAVYLEQTRLIERLARFSDPDPLVVFDVGMGIASNALAAIRAAQASNECRRLHLVSFENSLEGLRLALQNPNQFPTQAAMRSALQSLLERKAWSSADGRVHWELQAGDFREFSLARSPEVIFFDFYSPASCPELWTAGIFEKLFKATQNRRENGLETVLATYSAATSVRAALLLAGFHVGYGKSTALKSETTLASTSLSGLSDPLAKEWLRRLENSSKPFPIDVSDAEREEAFAKIRDSRQFAGM